MTLHEDALTQQAADNALRRQRDQYARQNQQLSERIQELEQVLSVVERVEDAELHPVSWLSPEKPKRSSATLVVMLSDTHFDEVVNPDEMEGLNAYNREIAMIRLERWAQNVIKLARHYLSGVTYDGIVVVS